MRKRLRHIGRAGAFSAVVRVCVAAMVTVVAAVGMLSRAVNVAYGEEQPATFTIMTAHVVEGKTVALSGVEATAYRIGTLDAYTGESHLIDPFTSLGDEYKDWDNASTMERLSPKLSQIIREKLVEGITATSTDDGTIAFGEIPHGVYFVVQTSSKGDAQDYYEFVPFIMGVPARNGGAVLYDVVCMPKFTPIEEPNPTEPPTPEPVDPDKPPVTNVHVDRTSEGTTVYESNGTAYGNNGATAYDNRGNTNATYTTNNSNTNTIGNAANGSLSHTGDASSFAPIVLGLLAGLVLVAAGVHRRLRDERE